MTNLKKAVTPNVTKKQSQTWCQCDTTLKELDFIRKDIAFQKTINKWIPNEKGQALIDAENAKHKKILDAIKADNKNGEIVKVKQFDSNKVYSHAGYEK